MLAGTACEELEDFVEAEFYCCWHLAHSYWSEDARVLLSGVTFTLSVP